MVAACPHQQQRNQMSGVEHDIARLLQVVVATGRNATKNDARQAAIEEQHEADRNECGAVVSAPERLPPEPRVCRQQKDPQDHLQHAEGIGRDEWERAAIEHRQRQREHRPFPPPMIEQAFEQRPQLRCHRDRTGCADDGSPGITDPDQDRAQRNDAQDLPRRTLPLHRIGKLHEQQRQHRGNDRDQRAVVAADAQEQRRQRQQPMALPLVRTPHGEKEQQDDQIGDVRERHKRPCPFACVRIEREQQRADTGPGEVAQDIAAIALPLRQQHPMEDQRAGGRRQHAGDGPDREIEIEVSPLKQP